MYYLYPVRRISPVAALNLYVWVGTHSTRGASAFLPANWGVKGPAINLERLKLVTGCMQQLKYSAARQKFSVGTRKNRKNIF